jgi:zinc transport system substrate-binding protein
LDVVASFYPLQFVVERVGGDAVAVSNLTPAGAEPHDVELTPKDVASVQDADLVVYLSGFSPAVDDAVADVGGDRALDVAAAAQLEELTGEDRDHEGLDPHFWLDPTRLADVADVVAQRLGALDPASESEFLQRAAAVRGELEALDAGFEAGLATCESRDLVTSHAAFGYLAERYGLAQIGITGLSPHGEPSPATLAKVADFVQEHGVTTIYYETLVDPSIAETIAAETGSSTAVLDPIEGLTADSAGTDYLEVMRANLESLRAGLACR